MEHKSSSIVLKFELLHLLFTNAKMQPFIESLDLYDLFIAHRFIWEKTIELGIKIKGKSFPQEAVTDRLRTISKERNDKNCPSLYKMCNPQECTDKHPDCARKMAIKQIMAMCAMSREFLKSS